MRLKVDPVGFVVENGNSYERLYLTVALGQKVGQEPVEELLALQNADGGWPWQLKEQTPSSVVGTARALELLLKTSLSPDSRPALDATYFLWARQRADGGWSENPQLSASIPSYMGWISTSHSMTYATADAANALIAAGYSGHQSVRKAITFLRKTQKEDGGWDAHVGSDYSYDTDIASMDVIIKALLLSGEDRRAIHFVWAVEAIVNNWEDWKRPVCAASALNVMLRLGYTAEHTYVTGLTKALVETQGKDGGWSPLGQGPSESGQTAYCIKQLGKCGVEIPHTPPS